MSTRDPRSLAGRPSEKSKMLGQVLTPQLIAKSMVSRLFSTRNGEPIKVLDPCVGPGTFPQQMIECELLRPGDKITMVDVDQDMVRAAKKSLAFERVKLEFLCKDYLKSIANGLFDYIFLNPPYIRQEWIDKKVYYQSLFLERFGLKVPGTSNLYVYFIIKAIQNLRPGGKLACIVYDSWQATNFGRWLIDYLNTECSSIELVPLAQQPFHGRLIDATIIYITRRTTEASTLTGQITLPTVSLSLFNGIEGFAPMSKLFATKRGLRLKQADFFLCNLDEAARLNATPFLKKVTKVKGYSVPKEHSEAALLLKHEGENPAVASELLNRLEVAKKNPTENVSILTWFHERPLTWMIHRKPSFAPLVFNYYIRKRPKHILNLHRAYSDNFYGLTPLKPISPYAWLATLNSTAVCTEILTKARNQGGGLAKIQLFEYRQVFIPDLTYCSETEKSSLHELGLELVDRPQYVEETISRIDTLIAGIFSSPNLCPREIGRIFLEVDNKARQPKGVRVCLG